MSNFLIVRPLTEDGRVGYDKFGQLQLMSREGKWDSFTIITDVRGKTCAICNHGWLATGESMGDQIHWSLVDDFVHHSCLVRHGALRDRADFRDALIHAQVRFRGLRPIPNAYWPPSYPEANASWYEAELIEYPAKFILGWRKRVAHVEIVPQGGTKLAWADAAAKEFEAEDVTKHFAPASVLLHAWSDEKVRDYVRRIVALLPKADAEKVQVRS